FDSVQPGERMRVRGPAGECFYMPGSPDEPLLLAGTGTGLAPLYAVLQDALRSGHRAPIVVVHGALHTDGFYLVDELTRLAAGHANVTFVRSMPEGTAEDNIVIGPIDRLVLSKVTSPKEWRAYLCGH